MIAIDMIIQSTQRIEPVSAFKTIELPKVNYMILQNSLQIRSVSACFTFEISNILSCVLFEQTYSHVFDRTYSLVPYLKELPPMCHICTNLLPCVMFEQTYSLV